VSANEPAHVVCGPFFEDLRVGAVERAAPAVTLTDGMAAVHRSIVGDRLRLALDAPLARAVVGADAALAHPALVWDLAIGQSTVLTGRVIANLFYRGLVLARAPTIGDTLRTSTEVVALRQTTPRRGRPATGLAVLRVRTVDQEHRQVLDFWRCAMLPLRDPDAQSGRADSFDAIPAELEPQALRAAIDGWQLSAFADSNADAEVNVDSDVAPPAPPATALVAGTRWLLEAGDVVSSAPELARLTLNVAAVHHDRHRHPDGRRLVYGGHTIGLAAAQACRALPQIVTIVGWHSCEHLAPVHEGDTLYSELELERLEALSGSGGALAHLRSRVHARGERGDAEAVDVLDWRFVAVLA
jgi:acyl dehydratase